MGDSRLGRWRSCLCALAACALLATGLGYAGAAPAGAAVPPPTLILPGVNANATANQVFNWTAAAGARSYRFQLSTTSSFVSPLIDQRTVATKYTPDEQLPAGTLYWRVASVDENGDTGTYTDARAFANAWSAPTPTAPADNASLAFPTDPAVFTWNPVAGAQRYTLEVSRSQTFSAGNTDYETPNTTYSLTEPATADTPLYWRVRATSGANAVSQWSATRRLTYTWDSAPTLVAPADGAAVVDTNFTWSPVAGAERYKLQVNPNRDFSNNMTIEKLTTATSYSPATPMFDGGYYWRVRAYDAAGHAGTWSSVRSVTRTWDDPPTPVTPAPAPASSPTVVSQIGFQWTPVTRAAYYDLEVYDGTDTLHCYTNHTSWSPYDDLLDPATPPPNGLQPTGCPLASQTWQPGVLYRWRVRAWDADQQAVDAAKGFGTFSNNGNYTYFTYEPDAPAITSPADNARVTTPNLQWTSVSTADHYVVTVVDGNGAVTDDAVTTYATSYTPSTLDPANGPFTWSVRAVDHNGQRSVVTERTFSLDAPTSTVGSVTQSSPANGSSGWLRAPSLTWQPRTDATSYVVRVWKTADGIGSAVPVATVATSYTPTELTTANTSYSWRVQAFDVNGASLGSSATRTFVTSFPSMVLPAGSYRAPGTCTDASACTVADTPTLSWEQVTNATRYVVTIANDANFTNKVSSYVTTVPTLTPRESLKDSQAGEAYYWYVQPCTYNGCGPDRLSSTRANAGSFRKSSDAVQPVSPAGGASVGDQVTFSWTAYDPLGAADRTKEVRDYRLQVSTDPDFPEGQIVDDVTVDATSYTADDRLYPATTLYWRVQAVDNSDNRLTWSTPRTITKTIAAPGTVFPASSAVVRNVPYLSWTPMSFAARYEVQVATDANFSDPILQAFSGDTEFSAVSPLVGLPAGVYSWRVRAIDASGNQGSWSATATFSLALDPAVLTGPDDASTVRPATALFQWNAVTGAAKYRWQLSTSSSFDSPTAEQVTQLAVWAPRQQIEDGTYTWRVVALDGEGNELSTSTTRSVTFNSVAPTATVATGPPWTVNLPVTVTFSKPVTGVDPDSLRVLLAGTTTAAEGRVTVVDGTTAKWTPDGPLVPGQSYDIKLSSAIQDGTGNALAATTVTRRVYNAVQNGDPAFTEHWDRVTTSSASGASYDVSATGGSTASLAFTGTSVSLVGAVTAAGGYADLYLDGTKVKDNLSFYSRTTAYRRTLWSATGLAPGAHTLKVVVQGSRPSGASGNKVMVDRFDVAGSPVEQTSAAVTETFGRVATSLASGGSYDYAQHATTGFTGTRAWFGATLRGTRVSVVGVRSTSSGTASIYLDGALVKTVSLRSDRTSRSAIYTSGILSDAVHSVKVYVNGTSTGSGSTVGIDYITAS